MNQKKLLNGTNIISNKEIRLKMIIFIQVNKFWADKQVIIKIAIFNNTKPLIMITYSIKLNNIITFKNMKNSNKFHNNNFNGAEN